MFFVLFFPFLISIKLQIIVLLVELKPERCKLAITKLLWSWPIVYWKAMTNCILKGSAREEFQGQSANPFSQKFASAELREWFDVNHTKLNGEKSTDLAKYTWKNVKGFSLSLDEILWPKAVALHSQHQVKDIHYQDTGICH